MSTPARLPDPTVDHDDAFARRLRGFGPVGLVAIAMVLAGNYVFAPLSAVLVLAWAAASRTPWREIGLVRPRSWPLTIVLGVAFGVVLKLAMKAVVMPLLGADPVNRAFHYLAGNPGLIAQTVFMMVVIAGIGEEILFRGFLFERAWKLLGTSKLATAFIVVAGALLFGAAHYAFQGLTGAQHAAIVGLLFGAIYATTRSLALLMAAHAAFDLTAYWIIYHDLETWVAGWVWS